MKFGAILLCIAPLVLLSACSGGSSGSGTQSVSNIRPRAFVSDTEAGSLQIVNAKLDTLYTASTIAVGPQPTFMVVAPNKSYTLVFDSGNNNISEVNNSTEAQGATIALQSWADNLAISPDNTQGYVPMPAAVVTGQPSGVLDVLDLVNNNVKHTLNIPQAHRVVVNHSGNRLLVFSDNSDSVTVINPNQIATGNFSTTVPGFDRPVWGVFSDDDSTAYIVDCGSECGGTNAGITVLHMSDNTVGNTVGLAGATMAVLISGNLYVAGSGHGVGTLQVVNTAGLVPSPPVAISNGYHDRMALGTNNKLFIGAHGCSNTGCLSIFDITSQKAAIDTPTGDVTGIAPILNNNEVYVVEGGELRIFDTNTSSPSTIHFIDIIGQATDVKVVDNVQ